MSAKQFIVVNSCCPLKCYEKIRETAQKRFHESFWQLADYKAQNVMISDMMREKRVDSIDNRKTPIHWTYRFPCQHRLNNETVTCQTFLLNVLCLNRGRFKTVQGKIKNQESLGDERGGIREKYLKLDGDVKHLIHDHCKTDDD